MSASRSKLPWRVFRQDPSMLQSIRTSSPWTSPRGACRPRVRISPGSLCRCRESVIEVVSYTYHLRWLVGTSGRGDNFEPLPQNLKSSRSTLKTYRWGIVTVNPNNCGDKWARTIFCVPQNRCVPEAAAARRAGNRIAFDCKVVGLADVALAKIRFVRPDVDGAEFFVLRGAKRTVQRSRLLIPFEAVSRASDFRYHQHASADVQIA